MADEFDLKQAVTKAGKSADPKDFANVDRFVKEVDKLQLEVDEMHRARNKLLTSLKRGNGADQRAITTYDTFAKSAPKDAARLRPQLAKYQQAADNRIKALKAARDNAGLKALGEVDAKLDAVDAFLSQQRKYPHSSEWLLAALGGHVEADAGPGARQGEGKDPATLPAIKHQLKINANAPGATFDREIDWFAKNAEEVDLSALKKARTLLPSLDAAIKQQRQQAAAIKLYLQYLQKPTKALEAEVVKSVRALDKLAADAIEASRNIDEIAAAIRKVPRKTKREKSVVALLTSAAEEAGRILEECWQELRPTGANWTPKPSENVRRATELRQKTAA